MNLFEEKTDGKEIFSGHIFNVQVDHVKIADGSIRPREVVEHHGGVCVVPIDKNGNVYIVRQFRYAVGRVLLEIPAGKLEKGENPLEGVKRELMEETGFTASSWTELGMMYPTPGYCSERLYVYLARGLAKGRQHLDDGEILEVESIPLDRLVKMIMAGEICDGKTVFGILKAYYLINGAN